MEWTLSTEERQIWQQRGWLLRRSVFAPEEVARVATEVDGLHERMAVTPDPSCTIAWEPDAPNRIRQLMDSERVCGAIEAMSHDPRLLDSLETLIGPDVLLFHSKLMMKAAGSGSFTPWHQDFGYWQGHSSKPSAVNAMLAIDAQTEANGAIRFVDGSHHQGLARHGNSGASSFAVGLPGGLDAYEASLCEMEPGDVVFFGALIIHGSGPNGSTAHRRANTFAFDVPGNREPELPPERMRRGRYLAPLMDGPFRGWR
jgi:hypothetical protein